MKISNKEVRILLCVIPWFNPLALPFISFVILSGFMMLFSKDLSTGLFILSTYGSLVYIYIKYVIDTIRLFKIKN
jgi:hypothetical protein